jgi:hypothetical protein
MLHGDSLADQTIEQCVEAAEVPIKTGDTQQDSADPVSAGAEPDFPKY